MSHSDEKKSLKTLFVYNPHSPSFAGMMERYCSRLNSIGYSVIPFALSPHVGRVIRSTELEHELKTNSFFRSAIKKLIQLSQDVDVLILFNGAHLPQSVIKKLSCYKVYCCFDDPESSNHLSKPLAPYFDMSLVGNIACLELYQSWGCKVVAPRPMGFYSETVHPQLREALSAPSFPNWEQREMYPILFCERVSHWRMKRLNRLESILPSLRGYGKGWPSGYVSEEKMWSEFSTAAIGINMHNSVGPINLRFFSLPANGLLQICDNRFFTAKLFRLNEEIVTYDDVDEIPEIIHEFKKNPDTAQKIALAGFKRAWDEYNEIAIWEKQMNEIQKGMSL